VRQFKYQLCTRISFYRSTIDLIRSIILNLYTHINVHIGQISGPSLIITFSLYPSKPLAPLENYYIVPILRSVRSVTTYLYIVVLHADVGTPFWWTVVTIFQTILINYKTSSLYVYCLGTSNFQRRLCLVIIVKGTRLRFYHRIRKNVMNRQSPDYLGSVTLLLHYSKYKFIIICTELTASIMCDLPAYVFVVSVMRFIWAHY